MFPGERVIEVPSMVRDYPNEGDYVRLRDERTGKIDVIVPTYPPTAMVSCTDGKGTVQPLEKLEKWYPELNERVRVNTKHLGSFDGVVTEFSAYTAEWTVLLDNGVSVKARRDRLEPLSVR